MKVHNNNLLIYQKQKQQQQPRQQHEQEQQIISKNNNKKYFKKPIDVQIHKSWKRDKKLYTIDKSTAYICLVNYLIILLIGQKLLRPVAGDWLLDCGDCHCKWNSGKKTADCKNLSMISVPENLSSEIQVLDLSFNRIPYLEENIFLTANLQNLHKLFIRNSTLQQINPRSFTQLEILIELDLSNNLLNKLQPNVFGRLVKVRALILNGNLLDSLEDGIFVNLKYLHKIELKDNQLLHMGMKVFENLPLLSQIYLDNNRLNHLRRETFDSLKRLTALSLDQNPWNCTCELQMFRDFVLRRNLYTPPTSCYYPKNLRGMLWVEDQPEAFACKPNIIYPLQGASIYTSKENVTLICRVHASQNTLIYWDFNKQIYRNSNHAASSTASTENGVPGSGPVIGALGKIHSRIQIQLMRDDDDLKEKEFGRNIFISRLTILEAEKTDEGVYTCLAENAGGKDAVQMNLLVQKPGAPRSLLLHGNLITVISLMTLGLFSVAVFLALITCCIYKRFKVIDQAPHNQNNHHHHHQHHQHINQVADGNEDSQSANIEGRTDVVLNVGSAGNTGLGHVETTTVSNLKHHLQKTNLNCGVHVNECDKYDEVLAERIHNRAEGRIKDTSPSNTSTLGSHYQQMLPNENDKFERVDKTYMEQNTPDKLRINLPHGSASLAEINRCLAMPGDLGDNVKTNGILEYVKSGGRGENKSTANSAGGGSGLSCDDYQPDLLPTSNNKKRYYDMDSPTAIYAVKTTKTINSKQSNQPPTSKSKYNSRAQEYLQAKCGGNGTNTLRSKLTSGGLSNSNNKEMNAAKLSSREIGANIPLTTATSLSVFTNPNGGFTLQQRQSKSLLLSSSQRNAPTVDDYGPAEPPPPPAPTENTDSAYKYRQPPPPPYKALQRTTNGFLLANNDNENSRENETAHHNGYWDSRTSVEHVGGAFVENITTLQTIVTASPSFNIHTTTGFSSATTPQRQLL